ncbi:protein PTST, chloroplastic [Mercurialis annua]|uniref:protein PTST, chloroplastic n=1 Tax=Mercurialis annua TaxID=3986 RepID=UPI0021610628|nr:protein PTST, chloroplastic [Mercurialis annua]
MKIDTHTAGYVSSRQVPWRSWSSQTLDWKLIHKLPYNLKTSYLSLSRPYLVCAKKHWMGQELRRTYAMPVGVEESSSTQLEDLENASDDSPEDTQPLSSEELKLLLVDPGRDKLIKKLSEANQHNRFLKRELHAKEDILVNFKSELFVVEHEIQALVTLAEEIAQSGIPEGSRKINGKYVQSHLLSRLQAVQEKLKEQLKDVDAAQVKEVHLFWCGMAESVQVMGTFDGWSQGEHLSPEYDGYFTKFTTTLLLRPGRYEIKFLVDGEWKMSPEYPTVGEGLTENNLLVVE